MQVCPSCGEDNTDRARFCQACAAPLGVTVSHDVRKTVTVVFTDVARSTGLAETLDPETLRGMMSRFFAEMTVVLERHGGTVEKFIGDAIMAVFGLPVLHEDDAIRAVRAGLEMQSSLAAINKELGRDYGLTIEVRTGINTGEVVAGDQSSRQALITGDAVNVAARLQQFAQPGEVLLGDATYRLVKHAVEAEALSPLSLKGKSHEVRAFRLVSLAPSPRGDTRSFDTAMVGREQELTLLTWAYERASSEQTAHLVTVLGVAGIGKSRLVMEFLRSVQDEATVLSGRCLPYGEGITFWPLKEVVAEAAGLSEFDSPDQVASKIAALLEDQDDAALVARRVAQAIAAIEPTDASEEVFWGVRKLFEALAKRRPLILVLEDIHWGETTFLDLIEHVVVWSSEARILLVCMARPELLDDRPGWAGGKLNSTSVLIEPFDAKSCDLLIDYSLGQEQVPSDVKAQIRDASGGNPLFVEEMVAMLVEEGLLAKEDGNWMVTKDFSTIPIPPSIQALLAARLDRLDDEERVVLQRASVVGEEFHKGAITELLPNDARSDVDDRLSTLIRKGLIRPQQSTFAGQQTFRFHHILIRDAAYEALPKQLRAELHGRFAGWLERAAPERLSEFEEILAYHLERAHWYKVKLGAVEDSDLDRRGVAHLVSAAHRATALGDAPAAVNLFSRAVAMLDARNPGRFELLSYLAVALMEVGDWTAASGRFDEAIAAAQERGDRRLEARAIVDRWELQVFMSPERLEEMRREVERLMEVFTDDDDHLGLARAWGLIAQAHWSVCRYGEAGRAFTQASDFARRAGDEVLEARFLAALVTMIVWGPTPVPEAIRQSEEILTRVKWSKYAEWVVNSEIALLQAMQGSIDEARNLLESMKAYFEDRGNDSGIIVACQQIGFVEMLAGAYERAESEFGRNLEILKRQGDKAHSSTSAGHVARALCAQHRFENALPYSELSESSGGTDDVLTQILWRCTRARVLAHLGNLKEAERLASEAVEFAETSDALNDHADALVDLADVFLVSGKREKATAALSGALSLYERKGNIVAAASSRTRLEEVRMGAGS
jgi:class 3 adenylate cyclase/tetratricopeptide (TPR) repeat protein